MNQLPDWLQAHLEATGRANTDGIHRSARSIRCDTCGRRVLTGLDYDRCGGVATCDPHEIDTNGELVALALGLRTYTLTRSTTSSGKACWNLDPRNQWSIAAGQRTALVAEHRCGVAIPATASPRLARRHARATPDQPDF